jgi:hypothetical protein
MLKRISIFSGIPLLLGGVHNLEFTIHGLGLRV